MKMKLVALFVLLISIKALSQSIDTIPPYKRNPTIPAFNIQLVDSTTWLKKADLSAKKQTLILYFSPDCGHCQLETEEMISNMKQLQKLQIIFVTSRPFEDVKNFSNHYLLNRFPNVKVGIDPARFLVNFYDVQFTPFSALYDKKGKLVKVYDKGIDWDEFLGLVK